MRSGVVICGLAAKFALSSVVMANDWPEDPAEKGAAIAQATKNMDLGFQDSQATMHMVLTNARGDESTRELRMMTLERRGEDEGNWSLIVFDHPRDIEGTALLTHARILEADDQWMYLPKLGRVKRISSANKAGPFMGSEFAFEDFTAQEPGKFAHTWLRDEPCPAPLETVTCHVTERRPLYERSGYTRQVVWSDAVDLQPRQIDYYDRKDALLKTLSLTAYTQYLDQYWRAKDLFMVNHVTGKKTRLAWEDYTFQTGLGEKDFDKSSLEHAR
ncbi:MAG: outer membrane lipoprotein-sorting protein [Alphaproteobacteria bacterium]|nr:MAG: outer membrane lipoprotein-sorting protein [Alphaproteobacteria bacterium]